MNIIKKIKKYFCNKKINKQISKYKYVHIMFNDKFNKPFVDFINRNFNQNDHIFLCHKWYEEFPMPEGENVISDWSYSNLNLASKNIEKVICHSLFDNELVDYLYRHQNILKNKAYWMIWGGDLYNAPRDKKNDFVRKNFKGYLTSNDKEVLEKKYNFISNTYSVDYVFPITKEMLDHSKRIEHSYIQIQINNSCDKTTLEILNVLSKFKNENIKVVTILSYGNMDYKDDIINEGKKIFGEKFEYIDTYMSPKDYAKHLVQNDILILNQNRQQGVGNINASIYLGVKVFIKSELSTYKTYNANNIKIYDTNSLFNLDFLEFVKYPEKLLNQQISSRFFNENILVKQWRSF